MIELLWYDDGPDGLEEKVARATAYYEVKLGRRPEVCLVHRDALVEGESLQVGDVEVRVGPSVLRDYFWIGQIWREQIAEVLDGKETAA